MDRLLTLREFDFSVRVVLDEVGFFLTVPEYDGKMMTKI